MSSPHDGRYAPSPTGPLHLGNLRTALLAWLFARSAGARFVLRIDDLDRGRSRREHEAGQLADLAALGLDWDGDVPRQSERTARYADALAELERQGLLYPCWCTRAELREAASAPHGPAAEGAYPGTCRSLTAAQRVEREARGRPPALRVRADAAPVVFRDVLLGEQRATVDDLVVRRADGTHAYNLAVVVDDHDQGVREVVRGADLAETTARQLWLADRLGLDRPTHAHVPLVLGADGRRLSKRDGDVTLPQRLALGETAARVRGALAAGVGLCEPGSAPSMQALLDAFAPDRVPSDAPHVPLPGLA